MAIMVRVGVFACCFTLANSLDGCAQLHVCIVPSLIWYAVMITCTCMDLAPCTHTAPVVSKTGHNVMNIIAQQVIVTMLAAL
jgi:hypothetical protein